MMTKMRCLFVVNVLVLKIMVGAAEIPDGQAQWAHKDAAATSAGTTMTDGRNVISPRMDFEEWTPLGRGDPLKNDPTFDYLPPVLDRVHYWKPPPPAATNRAHYYSSASTATPITPPTQAVHGGGYNRRFFLTDFSKREPVVATYAAIKRPPPSNSLLQPHHHHQHGHHHPQQQQQQQQIQHHLQTLQAAPAAGYHYSMHPAAAVPRTPLPMLTPPPYQQWSSTASDVQRQSASDVPGNAVAESKQPPPVMVRAPTRPVSPSSNHLAVVKALLDDEVDRTTVTTTGAAATTAAVWMTTTPPPPSVTVTPTPYSPPVTSMTTAARTTPPPPVVASDPLFAHYRQSPVTGRPMYLIIQGHSKVKTYGPASKTDDLNAAPVVQDHNHIGNQPLDEPSRRKRDHYRGRRR